MNAGEKLAIEGGTPVRNGPFPPWPWFPPEHVEAAADVLRSGKVNYWTGPVCREFEREYAAAIGRDHAIALANGTVALELVLIAYGIGPGDEVIVPSRTFIASASCAVARGARPVIADVDRESGNLTAATVEAALTPRTRAVVAVHLAGWPVEMDPLMELARQRDFLVIEDCAQAHGASYRGRPVGGLGHASAFSFCQDKIITTAGEGGLVGFDAAERFERAWAYKDHGKSWQAVYRRDHPPGFRWLHESFGTNWRLTEVQAALGLHALRDLPRQSERRRANASRLASRLREIETLRVPEPPQHVVHARYKFDVFLRPERLRDGWTRDRVMQAVAAEGIPCFAGTCGEIYRELAFPPEWRPAQRLPVARELGETSLTLLVHPTAGERDMDDAAAAVEKVMRAAAR